MKNTVLLILIILLTSCSDDDNVQPANQTMIDQPIKMVTESNKWYQNGSSVFENGATGTTETTKRYLLYFFEGDTIINGLEYKKMYKKQLDSIFHNPFSGGTNQFISTFSDLNYTAAMREDAESVYYIFRNQNTEELYANFNLNLGDVLNYRWNSSETVIEIDSIQIGTNYLTKYKLSNNQYFYEGIGASYGLFKGWEIGFEGGVYLSCFKHENDKIGIDEGLNFEINSNYCPEIE